MQRAVLFQLQILGVGQLYVHRRELKAQRDRQDAASICRAVSHFLERFSQLFLSFFGQIARILQDGAGG